MLLTGDGAKTIRQWKIEGDNLILVSKKENAHDGWINVLLNLGNGFIASGSNDYSIKIW
jgi:WD40 repeat protein